MDTVIASGTNLMTVTAGATTYSALQYATGAVGTVQAARRNVMPIAGTLKKWLLSCDAPGSGQTCVYTVQKNGIDTAMTFTVSGTATSGQDTTNSVSFVAGDILQIKVVGSASMTTLNNCHWTFIVQTSDGSSCILGSCGSGLTAGSATYHGLQHETINLRTTAAEVESVMPTAGTLSNFRVLLSGTPGSGKNYIFKVYKNGSVVFTATVSDLNTTATDASSVSVVAGDRVYVEVTPTGTPSSRQGTWGIQFNPTINGESVQLFSASSAISTSAVRYFQGDSSSSATEVNRQAMLSACVVKNLYAYLSVATGAAKSYQIQTSINASVTGSPTITITNAQSGNDVSTLKTCADRDLISIKGTPTSTPAATQLEASFVTFIDPGSSNMLLVF